MLEFVAERDSYSKRSRSKTDTDETVQVSCPRIGYSMGHLIGNGVCY